MFCFMGLAKVAEPLFKLRVPQALRRVARDPSIGGIDHWLGVRAFGALLRHTPLRHLNRSVHLADGERGLAEVIVQMKSAEAIHFWAAVLFTPYIAYVCWRGFIAVAASFVLVQVLFNIYPVLHLRLVRARLERVERARTSRAPVLVNASQARRDERIGS
jgi:hypothetical protein